MHTYVLGCVQPQFYWYFLVECFCKIYINFLYTR
jgi:hypothetical protein